MWAKRFPVPEFNRYTLKNLDWTPPEIRDSLTQTDLGCVAVNGNREFYENFKFKGENLLVVACKLPNQPVTISGNSFAWPIHRTVIADSLDAYTCNVLADWTTPRPMNTRFGPDGGITVSSSQVYILIGHKFADYWISNRIMLDNQWAGSTGNGFRVLSSSENEINDFHDAVIYFEW